jgi:hypothetical protein
MKPKEILSDEKYELAHNLARVVLEPTKKEGFFIRLGRELCLGRSVTLIDIPMEDAKAMVQGNQDVINKYVLRNSQRLGEYALPECIGTMTDRLDSTPFEESATRKFMEVVPFTESEEPK